MSGGAAPLRFLALLLGGWVAVRAAMLLPDWVSVTELPDEAAAEAPLRLAASGKEPPASLFAAPVPMLRGSMLPGASVAPRPIPRAVASVATNWRPASWPTVGIDLSGPSPVTLPVGSTSPSIGAPAHSPLAHSPARAVPSRWSVSAWALVRSGDGGQLAPGGTLGASQAGARITYRLSRRMGLSGRLYAPLGEPSGAEAALGIEWQPLRTLPVRLLAERRQAIGRDGRSAFALLAHGGIADDRFIGPVTLDAYAQAGIVGTRSREAFVDGAARLGVPIARDLSIGVGAWGAAQPGASRLDVGPQMSYRLPAFGETVRLAADWRVRIAGDARPVSGPALTLSTDF